MTDRFHEPGQLRGAHLPAKGAAGLESVESADGRLRWKSPFPLDGLVLLGGPLERYTRVHDGITLHAVVAPGKAAVAEDILAASAEYLDRYQPLIGDYPFSEFTVLEAFFSSGFAFPTCTQIAGSQLSEYKQYRRHGYLDHELLHNWWGNGILLDPDDGNWCEGLASYMGNYAGHVLDGDEAAARKQRRNHSNFLSAIEPDEDKPLGTFGLEDGAGRGIGYQKGAAVFHMLERKIGQDALHAGLRTLTEEQMGKHIGWETIREAMERASDQDLEPFFEQWVRRGGAPQLAMTRAEWMEDVRRADAAGKNIRSKLVNDQRAIQRLVRIGRPILKASNKTFITLKVGIYSDRSLNAMTQGGAWIYFTDTLLKTMNDDELAAIFAHANRETARRFAIQALSAGTSEK